MSVQAGVWIDHRKAVIVTVMANGHTTTQVDSGAERHVRYSGGTPSGTVNSSQPPTSEDTRERRFEGQLDKYYDEVIGHVRGADAILVFGPGEAKGQLRARLEHSGLGARIVGVESADKLTDPQIVAMVRGRLVPRS